MNALKNTREDLTFFSFLLSPNYTTFDQSLIIKLLTMKTMTFEDSAILFIDSYNGQYIPQSFANSIILDQWEGINVEDLQTCKDGPGNEWYWEAWCNIMDNATLIHPDNNQRYYIYQNEDVWLVPEGIESPEW